eukprot:1161584-Pelagomonas_calceolata.AAC.5
MHTQLLHGKVFLRGRRSDRLDCLLVQLLPMHAALVIWHGPPGLSPLPTQRQGLCRRYQHKDRVCVAVTNTKDRVCVAVTNTKTGFADIKGFTSMVNHLHPSQVCFALHSVEMVGATGRRQSPGSPSYCVAREGSALVRILGNARHHGNPESAIL